MLVYVRVFVLTLRYGDNPNRVQRHTQFQVILKPDPGNAQELYLGSLEALGIDTSAHDVRWVRVGVGAARGVRHQGDAQEDLNRQLSYCKAADPV